jgi:predicted dehydrogenase
MNTEPTEPLRIGILGAARIAELAIVEPAAALGHRLVAIAARDRQRAESYAAAHGVEKVHDSYADVLADPEVEVVYNPLANGLHGPWNLAAIAAHKHVLSEKPFSSNAEEAREVRDAALASPDVTVLEGFHYAHHPVMLRMHELLDAGHLGDLQRVEVDMLLPAPPDDDPRWSYELAGGAMMDLGCYALHALRRLAPWAGGAPAVVAARGGERAGHPGVDEWVQADFEFPSGVVAAVRVHMAADERRVSCRLVGSLSEAIAPCFVIPSLDDRVIVRTAGGEQVEELGRRSSYTFQLEALARHLRQSARLPFGVDDAVANMELIDDTYRAAGFAPRERTPVPADSRRQA